MRNDRIRLIVEVALSVALAAVLNAVKIWQMPQGGAITLAMLPIVVIAVRRGVGAGVLTGALFGIVDYFMEPYFVHWAQFLLDYPVAYALVGLAGVARPLARKATNAVGAGVARAGAAGATGAVIGGLARLVAHFFSGIIFFASSAPKGQPVWLYSIVYNATYVLPSAIACAVAAAILVPALARALDTGSTGDGDASTPTASEA